MNEILNLIQPLLDIYVGDSGILAQIISVIGSLRTINKPLFSFLNSIVSFTYWTEKDNQWLKSIEASKVYSGVMYVLDWVASVKKVK